jgi:hypothetical protein
VKIALALSITAILLTGCKIEILVPHGGDVASTTNKYTCSEAKNCVIEIEADTPFDETFIATPKEGYAFSKWQKGGDFFCSGSIKNTCTINLTATAYNPKLAPIFNGYDTKYLMPVFSFVGIDTDNDGKPNHIDTDDDNDGLPDTEDDCPLDKNLNCGINDVSGMILEDTIWSNDSGPIRLIDTVQIAPDATLTITAGTEIIVKSNYQTLQVFGSLNIQGTQEKPVELDRVTIRPINSSGPIPPPSVTINYAKMSEGGLIGHSSYFDLIIRNSTLTNTGSVWLTNSPSNTFIEFNTFYQTVAGEPFTPPHIVLDLPLSSTSSIIYIKNNIFRSNEAAAIARNGNGNYYVVENNSFLGVREIAVSLASIGSGQLGEYNNFTNNYWGTEDTSIIDSMIYDRTDDLEIPVYVDYLPILTGHHPNTPSDP